VGPYVLERELAQGGMGVVFEARDAAGRPVAIKFLLAAREADAGARQRFQVEAEALARLKHPGVVAVHAAGEHAGAPYFVMELVSGETLEALLERQGPFPPRRAVELTLQAAEALEHAHGVGILHRDLKPSNLLLQADGQVRIADFGLAKDLSDSTASLTKTGHMLGTPGYLAPEQARGDRQAFGFATDVYGLGATLFALLTGGPPFEGESSLHVIAAAAEEPAPPPSACGGAIDEGLDRICLACLEKAPADRYPSVAALSADLRRYLAGQDVLASSGGTRGWAWGVGLVVVLGAALGAALLTARDPGDSPPAASTPTAAASWAPASPQAPPSARPESSPLAEVPVERWLRRPVSVVTVHTRGGLSVAPVHGDLVVSGSRRGWVSLVDLARAEVLGSWDLDHCVTGVAWREGLLSLGLRNPLLYVQTAWRPGEELDPASFSSRELPAAAGEGRWLLPGKAGVFVAGQNVDEDGREAGWVARFDAQGRPAGSRAGLSGPVMGAALLPDGRVVTPLGATDGTGAELVVWDGLEPALRAKLSGRPECVQVSPDGRHVVVGMASHGIQAFEVEGLRPAGRVVISPLRGEPAYGISPFVYGLVFSPDGRWLFATLQAHAKPDPPSGVAVWDMRRLVGDSVLQEATRRSEPVDLNSQHGLLPAGDGRYLVAPTSDGKLVVWDGPATMPQELRSR
jgi:hypothetical protein